MWFHKKKSKSPSSFGATSAASSKVPSTVRPEATSSTHTAQSQAVHLLEQRLRKLEEQLADLSAKHPRIHIDNLHVHQPVLENLTFRLDHLDIKELSGSLNLGNNFGAKPTGKPEEDALGKSFQRTQAPKPKEESSEKSRDASSQDRSSSGISSSVPRSSDAGPERTSTGYRYSPPAPSQSSKV